MSDEEVRDEIDQVVGEIGEIKEVRDEIPQEAEAEQEAPKIDPIEEEARREGWRPKEELEEWKDYVEPKEYLARKPIFKKIDDLKRELNKQSRENAELRNMMIDAQVNGYQQALESIKAQRNAAFDAMDKEAFERAEAQRIKVEQEMIAAKQRAVTPVTKSPIVESFETRNRDWYRGSSAEDQAMTQDAYLASNYFSSAYRGHSVEEELSYVEAEIRRKYPHRFVNEKKYEPAPVIATARHEPSKNETVAATKLQYSKLPPEHQQACDAFVAASGGKATRDDYLKSLERLAKMRGQL